MRWSRARISLLVLLSVLVGVIRGKLTLLQATAVTDRWGTTHYGRLSALLTAPATIAAALAPWAGAVLAGVLGGYGGLFLAPTGTSFVAALLVMRTAPREKAGSTGT
ncbi:hypothetical protein J3S85_00655 [Streptomyces lavenduligriseus]|nr:hypothetical protein J3S85_00655 [Streptomyces lavenduligriseus]